MSTDTAPLALVTGSNRNPAHQLAAAGTDVIITYRTHEDEADTFIEALRSQGRRAEALRLDAANSPSSPMRCAACCGRTRIASTSTMPPPRAAARS